VTVVSQPEVLEALGPARLTRARFPGRFLSLRPGAQHPVGDPAQVRAFVLEAVSQPLSAVYAHPSFQCRMGACRCDEIFLSRRLCGCPPPTPRCHANPLPGGRL